MVLAGCGTIVAHWYSDRRRESLLRWRRLERSSPPRSPRLGPAMSNAYEQQNGTNDNLPLPDPIALSNLPALAVSLAVAVRSPLLQPSMALRMAVAAR